MTSDQSLSLDDRFSLSDSVRATLSADGGFLLHVDSGLCFRVNSFGARVWQAISESKSLSDIVDATSQDFPSVNPDSIRADTLQFVEHLLNHQLVTARARHS
jgi:hypothetical protein